MTFDQWFAGYLQKDPSQVERLLNDGTATRFLIAWSLFESRCFEGFAKVCKFEKFSTEMTCHVQFRKEDFLEAATHLHNRYQDKVLYKNLMHEQISKELVVILAKSFDALSPYEIMFMLLFVVYRFRNNIFHGNKGVESWLIYHEQITLCLTVMQLLISLSSSTLNERIQATGYGGA